MQEMQVQSLGWKYPPEKEIVTHSSILDWRIQWTEEPGGLQSMGLQRAGHKFMTKQEQTMPWCAFWGDSESKYVALLPSMMSKGHQMLGDPRTTRSTAALLFPSYYSLVSLWLSRIYPCFKVQLLSHFLYEIFSDSSSFGFICLLNLCISYSQNELRKPNMKSWLHITRPEPHCPNELL